MTLWRTKIQKVLNVWIVTQRTQILGDFIQPKNCEILNSGEIYFIKTDEQYFSSGCRLHTNERITDWGLLLLLLASCYHRLLSACCLSVLHLVCLTIVMHYISVTLPLHYITLQLYYITFVASCYHRLLSACQCCTSFVLHYITFASNYIAGKWLPSLAIVLVLHYIACKLSAKNYDFTPHCTGVYIFPT